MTLSATSEKMLNLDFEEKCCIFVDKYRAAYQGRSFIL